MFKIFGLFVLCSVVFFFYSFIRDLDTQHSKATIIYDSSFYELSTITENNISHLFSDMKKNNYCSQATKKEFLSIKLCPNGFDSFYIYVDDYKKNYYVSFPYRKENIINLDKLLFGK